VDLKVHRRAAKYAEEAQRRKWERGRCRRKKKGEVVSRL
jgi:hypothetical protein